MRVVAHCPGITMRSAPGTTWYRVAAMILLVGVACRDSTEAPPIPADGLPHVRPRTLSIVKARENGDAQRDTVLATLAPLHVLVLDDVGPAIGVPVYWTIALDTIIARSIDTTDGSGIASLALTFGTKPAVYTVS